MPEATPTTTFTWNVNQMERHLSNHAVYTVHYTVTARSSAVNAEGEQISKGAYGSIGLEAPESEADMIPFADLTKETVLGWVQEKLGGAEKVAEIEAALQAGIDEQLAPTKATGLPW